MSVEYRKCETIYCVFKYNSVSDILLNMTGKWMLILLGIWIAGLLAGLCITAFK